MHNKYTYKAFTKLIVKVAKLHPKLKIIIAHYFWPKLDYCFQMTEGISNIYFDTSALADPEVVSLSGGIKKVREILTKTIRRQGDSVLLGSDWPICSAKKHIDLIKSLPIPKEEKEAILYTNSIKLFRLQK